MVNRSPASNAFEFVTIAALRNQQLRRGSVPRVLSGTHKQITIAQLEVVAGLVTRVPAIFPACPETE
jgi:DNA-directed RNA polymerase subunit K/omega